MSNDTTFSIDELTATEIKTARVIVDACRETLADAAGYFCRATGASVQEVRGSAAFKALALEMLETAAAEFGADNGCRWDALRAGMAAAMSGAI